MPDYHSEKSKPSGSGESIAILDSPRQVARNALAISVLLPFTHATQATVARLVPDLITIIRNVPAALSGGHATDMATRTVGSPLKRAPFQPRPLVFNGKSGYLNSPEHHSIHSWYFSCRLFGNLI